jgi:hypothetical protein
MNTARVFLSLIATVLIAVAVIPIVKAASLTYEVLKPETSIHLYSSAHFAMRWNDKDDVHVSPEQIDQGLKELEAIWSKYVDEIGFPAPYSGQSRRYKTDVVLSTKGFATGSGNGEGHPTLWLNYHALKEKWVLAHETAHTFQFGTFGMRDSPYVGWFWESHAEWMAHQMHPQEVGCSAQLLENAHLYYGSTRDRYCNWQFWEYTKDVLGYKAINDIWARSLKPKDPKQAEEDPLAVLARNQGWSVSQLNDHFGKWAMHNVTWDYVNGDTYRRNYGPYEDRSPSQPHRVTWLESQPQNGRYRVPFFWAPQRLGYNLVRLLPDANRKVSISFEGLVQTRPAVSRFPTDLPHQPAKQENPDSDWRWGLVAVAANGKPRYSELQRGAKTELTFSLKSDETELWLVVTATPAHYHRIQWDQAYYTIYRYPWQVTLSGAFPAGSEPLVAPKNTDGAPHPNGRGWVAATAHVDATAYIAPDARVMGEARVLGHARVENRAQINGRATVQDRAVICGHAWVGGAALISEDARVEDGALVLDAKVTGKAHLAALTMVSGEHTLISGSAYLATVCNAIDGHNVGGTAQLLGDIELRAPVDHGVFYGFVDPSQVNDPRWGANRKEPLVEITARPVF